MATADTTQPQKPSSRRRSRNHASHGSSRLENDFSPNNEGDTEEPARSHGHHHRMSRHSSRPTKQLDFYQAMADFKAMFPTMENDVIEAVLRANDGAVDATIDQLLTMSIDSDGSVSPVNVPPSLISPVHDDCPEYNEQRTEDSPPSYTEAVHSHPTAAGGGDSIWTTPISSHNLSPSTKTKNQNKSPSSSLQRNQSLGHTPRRSPSSSQGRSPSSSLGSGMRRDFVDGDVDELSLSNTEPKRPLSMSGDFSRSHNFSQSFSHSTPVKPKHRFRDWNPPMLGTLPDDFLRLTPKPVTMQQSPMEDITIGRDVIPKSHSTRHKHSKSSSRSERKRISRSMSEKSNERSWLSQPAQDKSPLTHQQSFSGRTSGGSKSLIISSHEFSQGMLDEKMKENERRRKKAVMNVDPEMSQYLEDERLAIMLQNSEFLQELRGNEDFMKTLEKDRMNTTSFEPVMERIPEPLPPQLPPHEHEGYGDDHIGQIDAFPFSQPLPKDKDEDAELRRQLKNMGGASRKQFVTLAKKFFSRKKKKTTLKQIQKEKLAPSMINLLDSDEEDFDAGNMDNPYNQRTEIEPLPNNLQSVPSYKTVQRPPYRPETVVTYHDNQGNEMV